MDSVVADKVDVALKEVTWKFYLDALTKPLHAKTKKVFVAYDDMFSRSFSSTLCDKLHAVMLACQVLTNRQHVFKLPTTHPEVMNEYYNSRPADEHLKTWSKIADGFVTLDNEDVLFSELVESAVCHDWDANGRNSTNSPYVPWGYANKLYPLPNVWYGLDIYTQRQFNDWYKAFCSAPARNRYLSIDMSGAPIDLSAVLKPCTTHVAFGPLYDHGNDEMPFSAVRLVYASGAFSRGAAPVDVQWFKNIREQCRDASVCFYLRHLGAKPVLPAVPDSSFDWPQSTRFGTRGAEAHGRSIMLRDKRGADIDEWPTVLRVRELPAELKGAS